jgi:hypothetical protein
LKTFTPVGTAISIVESVKNSCPASGIAAREADHS